jgi:hypothetical protein
LNFYGNFKKKLSFYKLFDSFLNLIKSQTSVWYKTFLQFKEESTKLFESPKSPSVFHIIQPFSFDLRLRILLSILSDTRKINAFNPLDYGYWNKNIPHHFPLKNGSPIKFPYKMKILIKQNYSLKFNENFLTSFVLSAQKIIQNSMK